MLGGEGLELPATDDLKALVARVERFAAGARHPRDPRMIGGNLVLLRHSIDVLELQFAEQAAAFAATDHYLWSGSTTPIDWIRHHCQMTGTVGRRPHNRRRAHGRHPDDPPGGSQRRPRIRPPV